MSISINREQMKTLPAAQTVSPFGKVNYWDAPDGTGRAVLAYFVKDLKGEHWQTGLALDGSGSMQDLFGIPPLTIFHPKAVNQVRPVARGLSSYLAKKAGNGKVATLFWATGPDGKEIQNIGDLSVAEAETCEFNAPENYGTGTRLLPALKYFTDGVARKDLYDAEFGMYVFVTDGQMADLPEVIEYSIKVCRDIEAGRRHDLKLVIIGLGKDVDQNQLAALDNLVSGTSIDLWDVKFARDLKALHSLFDEVGDDDTLFSDNGLIRDALNNLVVDYRDQGMPVKISFSLPPGATQGFILEINGQSVFQPLP